MHQLGSLSAKYESNQDPAAIGFDLGGGWSYGTYQLATRPGTFGYFLEFCKIHYHAIYEPLEAAGGFAAASQGTNAFRTAWKALAALQRDLFTKAQFEFIVASEYDVTISRMQRVNIDLSNRSYTLADVLFSLACMAGPGTFKSSGAGCCGLVFDTLTDLNAMNSVSTLDDKILIDGLYNQKIKRIDTQREYRAEPASIVASVRKRVENEHIDAINELAIERSLTPES